MAARSRCSGKPSSRRITNRGAPLSTRRLFPLLALVLAALMLPQNALAAGSGWGGTVSSAMSRFFSSLRAGIPAAQGTSVKPAATGTCDPSSLSGYTSSVALASGLRLHWAVTTTSTIQLALEATKASGAGTGWFAVGWSSGGAMAPADAVMCNLATTPAIKAYRITGYSTSSVAATTAFTPGSVSLTAGTTTTIAAFTRSTGDGASIGVDVAGVNSLIWAYSAGGSKTVAYHNSNYGSADVDFSCDASSSATPAPPPPPATSAPPLLRRLLLGEAPTAPPPP
ncbi:hypothetical protein CLOP_g10260 [Closterium sp. NIES-67]|nr:hypothetical protein CLOP_g10260 [Closterium sp. NIES-67]